MHSTLIHANFILVFYQSALFVNCNAVCNVKTVRNVTTSRITNPASLGYMAEVIKLFSYSAQLRLKFILLINVKMPTIVGILTFMSRINYRLW